MCSYDSGRFFEYFLKFLHPRERRSLQGSSYKVSLVSALIPAYPGTYPVVILHAIGPMARRIRQNRDIQHR